MLDSIVLKTLRLRLPAYNLAERPGKVVQVYQELVTRMDALVGSEQGQAWIRTFDARFGHLLDLALITPVKKLDLLLWAGGRRQPGTLGQLS